MISLKAKNINEAWVQLIKKIISDGYIPDSKDYYRAERINLEIENPVIEDPHKYYPKDKQQLDIINNYITTGKNEDNMWHKWTKIYYHRLFDNPNSQIQYIINKLKSEVGGKAVASIWQKETDQDSEIIPCMLTLWCQSRGGKIDLHVHGQEGDIYKKSIMNMQEFITLQKYLAKELNLGVGRFIFSLDFGYVFTKDKDDIYNILDKI